MSKPVILTGLRANNDLHIGNYLGALLPLVDLATQKAGEYQINLFVPDLHSFTTPIEHGELQAQVMNNLKLFVAAGLPLDNQDVFIYRQSYIPAHSELTWILDCFTGFGEMSRMTQFKEKGGAFRLADPQAVNAGDLIEDAFSTGARVSVGLFNYPVLMASDILLYGAEYVPVGDDQSQHLEFARDISERLNKRFETDLFVVPKPVQEQHAFFGKDQGLRIRDLQTPTKKMSKSDESGKGVIFLTDTPDEARKKIMSAETDSLGEVQFDYGQRPGISNLLDMLTLFGGNRDEFMGQNQYGPLKTAVADKIAAFLSDFQGKLAQVDEGAIMNKLEASEQQMRDVAGERLYKVQQAVGPEGLTLMHEEPAPSDRLDAYVFSQIPEHSRAFAAKLIQQGLVYINGEPQFKAGYKLRGSDTVDIDFDPEAVVEIPDIELDVLYEDKDCVVINKPAGLLTHSKGAFNPEATVASWLASRFTGTAGERAGIVHRLDRATSGVMICAKTPEAMSWLQKQFSQRRVKKSYAAVIQGTLSTEHAIIDMPIERNPKKPQTFRVGSNGKQASTEYQVVKSNDKFTLLDLKPITGRTHQLRVHLHNLGHPILGDTLYGGKVAPRLFLHAKTLEVTLPNKDRKVFEVPVPLSFEAQVQS